MPGSLLRELIGTPDPDGASRVALVEHADEALALRIALIDAARERIDAQYYIWEKDLSGRLLAQRLFLAADRGVQVRVLIDDIELSSGDLPWLALDTHPNIEVRVFNPFRTRGRRGVRRLVEALLDFRRLNHRMHNKSLTVDGIATLVGGRNIGDPYFGLDARANFRDLDALAVGPAAATVGRDFAVFWDSPHARPLEALARVRFTPLRLLARRRRLDRFAQRALAGLHGGPWDDAQVRALLQRCTARLAEARVQVLTDHPDKFAGGASPIADGFGALRDGARRELLLESAYFVPDDDAVRRLAGLVARGVRVRVTTNSLASTDVPLVHGGYARVRRALLRAGVLLNEVRPTFPRGLQPLLRRRRSRASLHTKAAVVDRERAFVGSMNLDPRSARINTETGLLIDCPAFAAQVAEALDRTAGPDAAWAVELDSDGRLRWIDARRATRTLRAEPEASFSRRLQAWIVRLLPVHHWL
jgi:putative cardiolipin synthase